jgi:ribonuclease HII
MRHTTDGTVTDWFEDLTVHGFCAGVDEVGRGPLAGPVLAGAVVLDARRPIEGLRDSKRLSAPRRAELARLIRSRALACAVGRAEVDEIDELNILRASHLAMQRAVAALGLRPAVVYVDGNLLPYFEVPAVAVIGGDDRVPEIAAGSILAKDARDREMCVLAEQFPGYGLERHKGYATRAHLAALAELGPSPVHRRSFAPVGVAASRVPVTAGLLL